MWETFQNVIKQILCITFTQGCPFPPPKPVKCFSLISDFAHISGYRTESMQKISQFAFFKNKILCVSTKFSDDLFWSLTLNFSFPSYFSRYNAFPTIYFR